MAAPTFLNLVSGVDCDFICTLATLSFTPFKYCLMSTNSTPSVHLKQVTRENFDAVISLCVSPDQERFVGTAAEAIAKLYIEPDASGLAICDGKTGKVVGLLVYCVRPSKRDVELCRFLVDCKEQRRGYGNAALKALIKLLRTIMSLCGDGDAALHVYTNLVNTAAQRLYSRVGFEFDEEPCDEEHVYAKLSLSP